MARRSDHTAAELSSLIIDAAEAIIREEGLGKLSVRRIAARIGYASGTLYQHFADMPDLVLHVNGRTLARLEAAMHDAGQAETPAEKLHAYASIYLDFVRSNARQWAALFEYSRETDDPVPVWYGARIEALVGMITECFAGLSQAGASSPRHAAEMVWASVHSVCSLDAAGKLPLVADRPLDRLVHDLVDVHLSAYLANPKDQA
jgi:AcrR family transcriptional regulator